MGAAGSKSRYSRTDAMDACENQPNFEFSEQVWNTFPKGADGRVDVLDILTEVMNGKSVHFMRRLWKRGR